MKMYKTIKIKKKSINEISLRQALYWIDEKFTWDLQEADEFWKIVLSGPAEDIEKEYSLLNSSINDYILRYNLSKDSYTTRENIIKNALSKIANNG